MDERINQIGKDIIGAAFTIRNIYGQYLLEHCYKNLIALELRYMGHSVMTEVTVPIVHRGVTVTNAFRIDLLVDDEVIVELKAKKYLVGEEFRQLFTYLKLSNKHLGYIINFGADNFSPTRFDKSVPLDMGIYRVVNEYSNK